MNLYFQKIDEILSRSFYSITDRNGTYTRRKGLDRETNKTLFLKHIRVNNQSGSRLQELMQLLPALSKGQIRRLLRQVIFDSISDAKRRNGAH